MSAEEAKMNSGGGGAAATAASSSSKRVGLHPVTSTLVSGSPNQ